MTSQFEINGIALPESIGDGYKVYDERLSKNVQMISGKTVQEVRGYTTVIEYQYGALSDELYKTLLPILRSGQTLEVTYTVPETSARQYDKMIVVSYTQPKYMFSRGDDPVWLDFGLKLKGVYPHD